MATRTSVAWPPIVARSGASTLTIRQATQHDVPILELWDKDPEVIACVTDVCRIHRLDRADWRQGS
mgnify:CR=1 FL=1